MNRRVYLAGLATGLVGVAGCAQRGGSGGYGGIGGITGTASLRMSRISNAEIARKVTYGMDDGPEYKRDLAARIVTNGSATVEGPEPPIQNIDRVTHDGTVYRISYESSTQKTAYRYHVTINPVDGNVSEADTVVYEDLPAVDRKQQLSEPVETGIGTQFTYSPAERNQSVLVPTPEKSIIVWDSGQRARFAIRESERITAQATYHYTAEVIDSVAAYGAEFRRQHEFKLTGLTDSEREIVQQAITSEDGYQAAPREDDPEATPTEALEQLVDRFRQHQNKGFGPNGGNPNTGVEGRYLVRYDGQTYWTVLSIDSDEF